MHLQSYLGPTYAALFACGLLLALAETVQAQATPFAVRQVGPDVWAAIADETGPAGGNAGFVIGDDGVLVIDTFGDAGAARQLLARIRTMTPLPIKYVINTHYHFDHVGGNRVFVDAGAVVLAQRNVRSWIVTENLRGVAPGNAELRRTIEAVAAPTVLFEDAVDLYLGSRKIELRSFPGHTGGDTVVLVPDASTVFGGDLFWRHTLPNLVDASTKLWVDTLDVLAKTGSGYTFVPGHGDIGNSQDVMALREYLVTLRRLVSDAQARGHSGEALVEAVMPAVADEYGQWDFFDMAKPNILDMDAELSGRKRIPQPDTAK